MFWKNPADCAIFNTLFLYCGLKFCGINNPGVVELFKLLPDVLKRVIIVSLGVK